MLSVSTNSLRQFRLPIPSHINTQGIPRIFARARAQIQGLEPWQRFYSLERLAISCDTITPYLHSLAVSVFYLPINQNRTDLALCRQNPTYKLRSCFRAWGREELNLQCLPLGNWFTVSRNTANRCRFPRIIPPVTVYNCRVDFHIEGVLLWKNSPISRLVGIAGIGPALEVLPFKLYPQPDWF